VEKHNLYFKQSKCDFNVKEIPILGIVVGRGEVQMENNKVKAVKEWKTPTKIKEVESFLGFVNFYQHFIKNFSHTAKPLNKLKRKRGERWHSGRASHLCILCLSQTYLKLWVQLLSSPLCWVTA